jgi:hypothetical protein
MIEHVFFTPLFNTWSCKFWNLQDVRIQWKALGLAAALRGRSKPNLQRRTPPPFNKAKLNTRTNRDLRPAQERNIRMFSHVRTLMLETESVCEISVCLKNLTRLSGPENLMMVNRQDVSRIDWTSVFRYLIIITLAHFCILVAWLIGSNKIGILNI